MYVSDTNDKSVKKLGAGQTQPVTLPFTGLQDPRAVAAGVLELAADASIPAAGSPFGSWNTLS
ncbi:hypothetical protein [Rhodococcus sp. NPDC127528]|uniref:hypothetical protein n=1 Tax=unclassified Rhodococcus (in: high G+C Gram-positive bacteria) TaxID=192944 RepID=UPI003626B582